MRYLAFLVTSALALPAVHGASAQAQQGSNSAAEDERWFQIEVIVFDQTTTSALEAERWPQDIEPEIGEDWLRFKSTEETGKQPVRLIDDVADDVADQTTANDATKSTTSATEARSASERSTLEASEPEEPDAFKPLPESEMQLLSEYKSLQRSSRYTPMLHVAWRQPVPDERNGVFIRLTGGKDFSEDYQFDGFKHTAPAYLDNEHVASDTESAADASNYEFDNNTGNTQSAESATEQTNRLNRQNTFTDMNPLPEQAQDAQTRTVDPETPKLRLSPWQLDGGIKVWVERYLHVDTKLYLRREGKAPIDISALAIDANETPSELALELGADPFGLNSRESEQTTETFVLQQEQDLFNEQAQDTSPLTQSEQANQSQEQDPSPLTSSTFEGDFDWQFGDDFLLKEPEPELVYVDKLISYPMIQTRRMRSGELHYFDHPLFGVIVLITPYDPYAEESPDSDETTTND